MTKLPPLAQQYHCRLLLSMPLLLALSACGGSSSNNTEAVDAGIVNATTEINTTAMTELGQRLFEDSNLSNPVGQSCATCHLEAVAFTDPDSHFATSEGAIVGRFGNRNTPTAKYAALVPAFVLEDRRRGRDEFVGGLFLDGRASTLELQAQVPFLNPLEMNMADAEAVVAQVRLADYAAEFEDVFGVGSLDNADSAFEQMAIAIAAFERTSVFAPFSSKFDNVQAGLDVFTAAEQRGLGLFNGRANCDQCHESDNNDPEIFTDFEYKNVGVPANINNPFLTLDESLNPDGVSFVDLGLGGVLNDDSENGKFRTPTLRNVALTAPYMHNGVFNTLTEVVNFYNRRDVDNVIAEVNQNVESDDNLGRLGLNADEVQDLVAFLRTLSD